MNWFRCAPIGLMAAIIAMSGGGMRGARGDSIALWDFNGLNLSPAGGVQAGSASLQFTGTNLFFGGGTTVNEVADADPNFSLSLLGTASNNRALVFQLSMTNYQALQVTYATERSPQGFKTQTWKYSLDGSSYTALSPVVSPTANFAVATADFSGVAALNNAPTVYVEMVLAGATSTNDGNMFDNFVLSAASMTAPNGGLSTPLPAGAWVGGAGLLGLAAIALRRRGRVLQP